MRNKMLIMLIVTTLGCIALGAAVFCLAANYPKSYTVRTICPRKVVKKHVDM